MICSHYLISGRVQGVWFRAYTQQQARRLGIRGWVRNLRDGRVEALATGEAGKLARFEALLREGPEHARVDTVQVSELEVADLPESFAILSDSEGTDARG